MTTETIAATRCVRSTLTTQQAIYATPGTPSTASGDDLFGAPLSVHALPQVGRTVLVQPGCVTVLSVAGQPLDIGFDATTDLTMPCADLSRPRRDVVAVRATDDGNGDLIGELFVVAGAASPVAHGRQLPPGAVALAFVDRPPAPEGDDITEHDITDVRPGTSGAGLVARSLR